MLYCGSGGMFGFFCIISKTNNLKPPQHAKIGDLGHDGLRDPHKRQERM